MSTAPPLIDSVRGQGARTSRSSASSCARLLDLVVIAMLSRLIERTSCRHEGQEIRYQVSESLGEMMGVLVMEKAGLKEGDVQITASVVAAARLRRWRTARSTSPRFL